MVATSQYKTQILFEYTWQQVVQAYWNRYPNPASTHVLTEDTIKREVRDGKLYTRRLLSKTNSVPKWGERFYKNAPVYILEDSVLDVNNNLLITYTRNIGFKKIMQVEEVVEYTQQNEHTVAVRRAYISSQVFGFSRAIRKFGLERFKSNSNKASLGFKHVLRNMFPQQFVSLVPELHHHAAAIDTMPSAVKQEQTSTTMSAMTATQKENIKKAANSSYGYVKAIASKLSQMFSIRS